MQKILLLRFSSIGDIVLTSPVVRCLKTQLPNVEIHFLTKKAFASILDANPYIDQVHTFDKDTQPLKQVVKALQKEQYTLLIDLHKNLRSWYVARQLGIKTIAFNKLNLQKWLLTQFKIDKMPHLHIVDRYLDTVRELNIKNDDKGLDYHIPPQDYIDLTTLDQRLTDQTFIVFVIGAAHATKRLPASKIKSICKMLPKELIVLIGGKGDREAAQIIETAGNQVINACGQFNLHQSASIVDRAKVVIAHDTGFMHIAAALKRPIVSIWGNTVPKFGMYPYLPSNGPKFTIIEQPTLTCRPCSKIGHPQCPKGHFNCMNQLDEATIVEAVLDILDNN